MCIEYHIQVNMYHVSAQGVDEHMINVHYYSCETCSLVSAIVYYFWQCPLFEVQLGLRGAMNFQSCEMDTRQMAGNKQKPYCQQWRQSCIL